MSCNAPISELPSEQGERKTHLANNPDRTKDESNLHAEHDLHETLDERHDSLGVLVLLHRLEDEVEVERLLGRSGETRVEERGVESAVEAIRDGLRGECQKLRGMERGKGRTRLAAETW